MGVQVASNMTKTKVFNNVMKHRPRIWLPESLCGFLSTLGLPRSVLRVLASGNSLPGGRG